MPTMYECLSKYCSERNIQIPRKFYRCQLGHWINDRWKFGAYGRLLTQQQQREGNETHRVLCYPLFFEPVIMQIIEDFFISKTSSKGSGTLPEPFQNPSKTLKKGIRNPSGTLPKPFHTPSLRDSKGYQKGFYTPSEGSRKSIETLSQPLANLSQSLQDSFDKAIASHSEPISISSTTHTHPINTPSGTVSDTLGKDSGTLPDPTSVPSATDQPVENNFSLKRLRKRIYR